jgi:hypothetical protein
MSVEHSPPIPAVVAIPQAVEAAIVPAILFLVFAQLAGASARHGLVAVVG